MLQHLSMNPGRHPQLHLAYCQNIHPGETWSEHFSALKEKATGVRTALNSAGLLAPGSPFGLGLRLSAQAAAELQAAPNLSQGNALFHSEALYPFSINGFPYGKFHQGPVKQNVYAPDWRSAERLEYTVKLADALAFWLPERCAGSISTVPGSYAAWIQNKQDEHKMAETLGEPSVILPIWKKKPAGSFTLGWNPSQIAF